jgi:hypothetical protein
MLYTPLAKSRIRLVGWTMKHTVKTTQPENNSNNNSASQGMCAAALPIHALSRLSLGFLPDAALLFLPIFYLV